MHAIDAYAREVVAGRVPAGKYHRLACVRHLRDRRRGSGRCGHCARGEEQEK